MSALFASSARFSRDDRGAVAPIFGLMAIALFFLTGMAIDFGRITHMRSKVAAAADGAALAAGRAMLDGRMSDAEVEELGRKFFFENINHGGKFGDIKNVSFSLNREASSVTVHIDSSVPMTITKVQGFNEVNFPVDAAVSAEQHDIELAMALDVTGSMSGSKIADLRTAATDLVDILIPDGGTPYKVRIGLAPYSASVNAGPYAATVTNGLSSNGCVHERGGADAFTDAAPARDTWLGFRAGMYCPTAQVTPLTDNASDLKRTIGSLTAGGSTAGHIGAAWADYLVSPKWSAIWPGASRPVAYNDPKTVKAVVLMTDGEFNTWYVGANGNSDAQARKLCTEMKKENVTVYAIGFMSPASAEAMLKHCASSENHFFNASNGNELRSAFIEIANQLNNLRLTQ